MPLASLRCRSARFDDERLNQKVKIATLKNECEKAEAMRIKKQMEGFFFFLIVSDKATSLIK